MKPALFRKAIQKNEHFVRAENAMQEYNFPPVSERNGYELFPAVLEDDPLVLFHATPMRNLQAIVREGFKARPPLESVSYAKSSAYCLTHLFTGHEPLSEEAVVIAVRFESLSLRGIKDNHSDIHVYAAAIQPVIVGYCAVPVTYLHR